MLRWNRKDGQFHAVNGPFFAGQSVAAVALSSSGDTVSLRYCTGTVQVRQWASLSRERPAEPSKPCTNGELKGIQRFSADGHRLFVAVGKRISMFTATAGSWSEKSMPAVDEEIEALAVDKSGSQVAAATNVSRRLHIWTIDAENNTSDSTVSEPGNSNVNVLEFSEDGQTILAGTEEDGLIVWDPKSNKQNRVSTLHRRGITTLATGLRDGRPVALSAEKDGQIVICRMDAGQHESCGVMARLGTSVLTMYTDRSLLNVVIGADKLYSFDLNRAAMLSRAKMQALR